MVEPMKGMLCWFRIRGIDSVQHSSVVSDVDFWGWLIHFVKLFVSGADLRHKQLHEVLRPYLRRLLGPRFP